MDLKKNIWFTMCLCITLFIEIGAQTPGPETVVIETAYGKMKLKLYMETPVHRENFIKLVKQGYFDSLMFHRVIKNFVMQGGDPLSKRALAGDSLGHGEYGKWLKAEFNPALLHKKGALAAAREGDDINPERMSSACQFYIVAGKVRNDSVLNKYEERMTKMNQNRARYLALKQKPALKLVHQQKKLEKKITTDSSAAAKYRANKVKLETLAKTAADTVKAYRFSEKQRTVYKTVGGTPHLDGGYTVFGEVIEGFDLIDLITTVPTDKRDRPLTDIRMKVYLE